MFSFLVLLIIAFYETLSATMVCFNWFNWSLEAKKD